MKDSKHYAQRVKKFFRALSRKEGQVRPATYADPIQALVYAGVAEFTTRTEAKRICKAIERHFVDVNDLRVSRSEEILEVIGSNEAWAKKIAKALPRTLMAVFNAYDGLNVEPLMEMGKRQARKALAELEGISRFVADYFFVVILDGHAIPLNETMLNYLRANELVHPDADDDDIIGFLERQISAADGYTFYRLLRQAAETSAKPSPSRKKKK